MQPKTVRQFLSEEETAALSRLAGNLAFEPGRQETRYEKAPVPDLQELRGLRARSLAAMGCPTDQAHDCYLLRYPEGSSIPPHRDDAPAGSAHIRLNAVVVQADVGGSLFVEGALVELTAGDAVVFRPDVSLHAVTDVRRGTRLVWSVGTLA